MSRRRLGWSWAVLGCGLLVAATLLGCVVDADDDDIVCIVAPDLEPNDVILSANGILLSSQAQDFGIMERRDCFTIDGRLQDPIDTDGFRFTLRRDQTLIATLDHSALVDLDILFVDADRGILIQDCGSNRIPEQCSVSFDVVSGDLTIDVVVISTFGSGSYTLEVLSR